MKTKLSEALVPVDYNKSFLCGRRSGIYNADLLAVKEDHWEEMPDGTHTCSFCGSISEPEFFDIVEHFIDNVEGYHFGLTDKSYKYYVSKPGVRNAKEGAIKFYTMHVNKDDRLEDKELLVHTARQLSIKRLNEKHNS